MASEQTLRAVITVLDRASEPIHRINQRFERMSEPIRHIGDRLGTLAEEVGLVRIGEHAHQAFEHVRRLGEGVRGLVAPLAALGALGSAAGLFEVVKHTAEWGEQLLFGSQIANMSAEALTGWHYAAGLVNVDLEKLDRGFAYLNRNIAFAAMGKEKDVAAILGHMGLHNMAGHLVQTADALKAVSAEVKHLVDSGQTELAEAMLSKLFGARSGAQLLPLFTKGPVDLQREFDSAKLHGLVPTKEQIEAAENFGKAYKELSAAAKGTGFAIGNELMPALTPVILEMTKWLDANREWLAIQIGDAFRDLTTWLREMDFTKVAADLAAFGRDIAWVFDKLGGVKGALIAIAGISLMPTILAFFGLARAVGATALAVFLIPLGEFIITLGRLVPAITSAAAAMAAFDLAADANPIGAVIAAVSVLIAAGTLLYVYWDPVSTFFQAFWTSMPEWAQLGVQAFAVAIVPFIAIPMEIYAHWEGVRSFFETLWQGITQIFEAAWAKIKPIVDALRDAMNWISNHLPSINAPIPDGIGGVTPITPLQSGALGTAGQKSDTKVTIDFKNMPQGVAVSTQHSGDPTAEVNVGHAFQY
jgi:hypothetical protein